MATNPATKTATKTATNQAADGLADRLRRHSWRRGRHPAVALEPAGRPQAAAGARRPGVAARRRGPPGRRPGRPRTNAGGDGGRSGGAVRAALPDLPAANVVAEPVARNTAPAVGLGAVVAERRAGPGAIIAVFPADPFIGDEATFERLVRMAIAEARETIVTIGVRPTHAETGFGYLGWARASPPDRRSGPRVGGFSEARSPDRRGLPRIGRVPVELGHVLPHRGSHARRSTAPPPGAGRAARRSHRGAKNEERRRERSRRDHRGRLRRGPLDLDRPRHHGKGDRPAGRPGPVRLERRRQLGRAAGGAPPTRAAASCRRAPRSTATAASWWPTRAPVRRRGRRPIWWSSPPRRGLVIPGIVLRCAPDRRRRSARRPHRPALAAINPRVFREDDIRGNGDADFPDDFVADLGRATGAYFAERGTRRITLGRDCRLSSPRIHAAFKRERLAAGLDVVDVGIVHTPALYFSVFHLEADGGVMITASHNPPRTTASRSSRPETIYGGGSNCAGASSGATSWSARPRPFTDHDILADYVAYMAQHQARPAQIQGRRRQRQGTGGSRSPSSQARRRRRGHHCDPDGASPTTTPIPPSPRTSRTSSRRDRAPSGHRPRQRRRPGSARSTGQGGASCGAISC